MVSYGEIRRWQARPMHQTEDELKNRSDLLLRLADELDLAGQTPSWSGEAGRGARRRLLVLRDDLEDAVAQLAAVRSAIGDAGDWIERVMVGVAEAEEIARAIDCRIDDAGTVHRDLAAWSGHENRLDLPDLERKEADLRHRVDWILWRAGEIDRYVLRVLDQTRAGEIDDGGAANLGAADQEGEQQGEQRTEALVRHLALRDRYQVAPDPDGMTAWPDGVLGLFRQKTMTTGEARMLDDLSLPDKLDAQDIYDRANERAQDVLGGQWKHDGHANAFRHAYWNALMAQRFGEEWAADFATAHERDPGAHPTPVAMDLYNNEVGRRIAVENPDASAEELEQLVVRAVENGEMVVVDEDKQLTYSNETPVGEWPTGGWPTENYGRGGHTDPGPPDAVPKD